MKKWMIGVMVVLCLFCSACGSEEEDLNVSEDELKFKEEYESYNDSNLELEINEDNLMKYSTTAEVNEIISSGTGVIYIGSPSDDLSRKAVDVLIDVANNTDLETIYYVDSLDGVTGIDSISDAKIPLVLFVLEGEIKAYHIGTIDDKTDLTDDEVIELYNKYLDGIHEVLQDSCDEHC